MNHHRHETIHVILLTAEKSNIILIFVDSSMGLYIYNTSSKFGGMGVSYVFNLELI